MHAACTRFARAPHGSSLLYEIMVCEPRSVTQCSQMLGETGLVVDQSWEKAGSEPGFGHVHSTCTASVYKRVQPGGWVPAWPASAHQGSACKMHIPKSRHTAWPCQTAFSQKLINCQAGHA